MKTFELTNANGNLVAYGNYRELKLLAKVERLFCYFILPTTINI